MKNKKLQVIVIAILICAISLDITGIKHVYANSENTGLYVTLKENVNIYIEQELENDLFRIELGSQEINEQNLSITPEKFTAPGEQEITFRYYAEEGTYIKKIKVNVVSVEPISISADESDINLIEKQVVEKEHLPEIYLNYNNGTKESITDYSFVVDWEKEQILVRYGEYETNIPVHVEDNKIDYLEIKSLLDTVPENYIFSNTDLEVIVHYTNGDDKIITDYQILPYKLAEGHESVISVEYEECVGQFKIMATEAKEQLTESSASIQPEPTEEIEKTATPKETDATTQKTTDAITPEPADVTTPKSTNETTLDPSSEENEKKVVESTNKVTSETTVVPTNEPVTNTQVYIDKTPPETTICEKTYKKNVTITATDDSGIVKMTLQGKKETIEIENGYKLTKEGSYSLILTDVCGNTKKVDFKLQKKAKKITLSYIFEKKWNIIHFSAKVSGTSRKVNWSTSNKKVATVTQKGKFRAKTSGTVYIIAKLDNKEKKQKIKIQKDKKIILMY